MTAVLTASATFAPADRISEFAFVRLGEAKEKPRTGEDGASRVPGEAEPWMGGHPIPRYIGHPNDNFQYCFLIASIRKTYVGLTGIAYAKNRLDFAAEESVHAVNAVTGTRLRHRLPPAFWPDSRRWKRRYRADAP